MAERIHCDICDALGERYYVLTGEEYKDIHSCKTEYNTAVVDLCDFHAAQILRFILKIIHEDNTEINKKIYNYIKKKVETC